MKIKKGKAGALELSNNDATLRLLFNNSISLTVETKDQETPITSPGEYEYAGIGITALELATEQYEGHIDIVRTALENVHVLYVPTNISVNKKLKDNIGTAEVLVVEPLESKTVKQLIDAFNPEVVVLKPQSGDAFTKLVEAVKKEFGVDTIEEESTIKLKAKDLDEDDDAPVSFMQLK